jgi:hypothetical protein
MDSVVSYHHFWGKELLTMQGKNIRAVSLAVAVAAGTVAAQKVSF